MVDQTDHRQGHDVVTHAVVTEKMAAAQYDILYWRHVRVYVSDR